MPFTLIADPTSTVIGAFGDRSATLIAGMAHREAYLIKGGKVIYADYKGKPQAGEAILMSCSRSG